MKPAPRTLLEAVTYFADPDRAHAHFISVRWPNGVACPRHGCGPASVQAPQVPVQRVRGDFNAREGVDADRFLSTLQGADGKRIAYAALTSS